MQTFLLDNQNFDDKILISSFDYEAYIEKQYSTVENSSFFYTKKHI